ncbi:FAD/NAD(P)-binding protein [Fimbriiglobus ruber]|uniref:Hydroxyacylglutathione hydrolase n=1 Tax=Fimbriiglobus ruber TaxID=1908690 RepID=A0A225DK24_9BACT|nr:FAD/NAD(P)-binding protein [Fimbriiglobus ruber]OWK37549.1 Hydroxyacylglutathione hydrolase [Fimbriiglobus ruber]
MIPLNPRLEDLVRRLDELGPEATLAGIARHLEGAALAAEDVAAFVRPNPASYSRARVVRRDHYELLVMTWLPGQASVPHDHVGSICALQVVQGNAVETNFSVAADGYADLEYETPVGTGQVSSGQDAGIHSIRNASADGLLVTVHVYAPPFKDARRFTTRPTPAVPRTQLSVPTVVVIGGGFSGTMTAAQLLRHGANLRVVLVERRGTVAEGLAYATQESAHLLNVPAARMSAWPDRPEDFLNWARRRDPAVAPGDFLPRQWYGHYLRETLHEAARGSHADLSVLLEEVRRVARHPAGGWMVHLGRGTSLRADVVVLAIGHRPPSDPLHKLWTGPRDRFLADPWQPYAVRTIPPDDAVAILGSGLTAIDAVLSLNQHPRTAPVTLISRHGLLPNPHAAAAVPPVDMGPFVQGVLADGSRPRAGAVAGAIHRLVRQQVANGGDWRSIVDGLRPHTARLWQGLDTDERRRFLGRLRPFWEVHRHRMARSIAAQLQQFKERGLLEVLPGQIVAAEATRAGVKLTVRSRNSGEMVIRDFQWVINCTGPAPSNRAEANPAIGSLLVDHWVRRDELSLGLDTTAEGYAISAHDEAVPDLLVVGTLRKPREWESTAVPELRQQAAVICEQILRKYPADACI